MRLGFFCRFRHAAGNVVGCLRLSYSGSRPRGLCGPVVSNLVTCVDAVDPDELRAEDHTHRASPSFVLRLPVRARDAPEPPWSQYVRLERAFGENPHRIPQAIPDF
jgi:hypothetical protein